MTPPCKDCPDRFVGCHGVCEKYLRFNEERKMSRAQAKARGADGYFVAQSRRISRAKAVALQKKARLGY